MRSEVALKNYFLVLVLCVFCSACIIKKRIYRPGYYLNWFASPKTLPTPKEYRGYSLNAYNALAVKPPDEMCIAISEPNTMSCKEGTTIEFPADPFVYENGRLLKCTMVCIRVWEFYKMGDIIAAGLTTTSAGNILCTEGMVYVQAECHGQRLKLKSGKKVKVKMPANNPSTAMKAFAGILRNGIIDWSKEGNTKIADGPENADSSGSADSTSSGEGGPVLDGVYEQERYFNMYTMSLNKLGWINCDRFYDIEKQTNLLVRTDSVGKTFVALIFKEMKSVLPGYDYSNNVVEFSRIPYGKEVSVLAYRINEKEKTAIVGMQDVVLGEVKQVTLNMEKMDLDNFKSVLAAYE